MKLLPSIGIIGGAGPEAGALLFRQIIRFCQKKYGCIRDSDYPLIHLISYPFSEMLAGKLDKVQILSELKWVYDKMDADIVVIACNTLHSFLDGTFAPPKFYHLIKETASCCKNPPLLLCTSTSKSNRIHERFFKCFYPAEQQEVDQIIDAILAGSHGHSIQDRLRNIIAGSEQQEILLGCTELSLLNEDFPLTVNGKTIIDPSLIAAEKITDFVFSGRQ